MAFSRSPMLTLFNILFVLIALLLIAVILIQQPKTSGGLFSGTGQSLLGTSGKTFWTKFTTILAAVFMGFCLLLAVLSKYQQVPNLITDTISKQQQAPAQQPPPVAASTQAAPKPQSNPAPQGAPGVSGPMSAPAGPPKN
jgi:preprotein translocase subunit SecG